LNQKQKTEEVEEDIGGAGGLRIKLAMDLRK
jgi:hypothetical protein